MADHSMQDINDLARIGYVIDNYDNVKLGLKDSKAFRNSDGTRAKTVEITKIIGDKIYHVIEAVPVSRRNTANTISVYIENIKIEAADRAANATKDPGLDVQNEVYPATSTANITLSDNAAIVEITILLTGNSSSVMMHRWIMMER